MEPFLSCMGMKNLSALEQLGSHLVDCLVPANVNAWRMYRKKDMTNNITPCLQYITS